MNKLKLLKSINKIGKITLFIFIKEGYLYVRNLIGIYYHPKTTLYKILKNNDLSQELLIFGLPAYLWLFWFYFLVFSRIFINKALSFGFFAKLSLVFSSFLSFFLLCYFVYYLFEISRKGKV